MPQEVLVPKNVFPSGKIALTSSHLLLAPDTKHTHAGFCNLPSEIEHPKIDTSRHHRSSSPVLAEAGVSLSLGRVLDVGVI